MSNNIFSGKRFQLLFKQHFIHHGQFLWLSAVAYMGVIFIMLTVVQIASDLKPHNLESFQGFLIGFFIVFSMLYVGHSFPAFRSKESTIPYLMIPASTLEKFLFELVIRIVLILVTLPLLYWLTFNLHGYFFAIFTDGDFSPVGMQYLVMLDDDAPDNYLFVIYAIITGGVLLGLSVAFAGSAMFDKQPLVKSLFSVAVIVAFFGLYSYFVVEILGVGRYNPPDTMMLVPLEEKKLLTTIAVLLFLSTAVFLFVAFRKLKEREV
jgi:hypothetical protein